MEFTIRKAVIGEEKHIVSVIVRTWKSAYRGIIDDAYLDSLEENNQRKLERVRNDIINGGAFVALIEETIIGAATFGASRNERYKNHGELVALYILPEYEKQGIGAALINAVRTDLTGKGYKAMLIDCLSENSACFFYRKMGGKLSETSEIEIGGRYYPLSFFVFDLS
jgi:GNAT superfamily N-acetyltransferase